MRQPGTLFFSLAWRMARSTELRIPVPVAVRSPESGAMTPILTTLVAWPAPVSFLSLLPHPAATSSGRSTTTDPRQRRLVDPAIPTPSISSRSGKALCHETARTAMILGVRILAVSGSLQARSSNRAVLRTARRLASAGIEVVDSMPVGDVPAFNSDLEGEGATTPAVVVEWRNQVA